MIIHKAKVSDYASVTAENVANYIKCYLDIINSLCNNTHKELKDCNKTQLNAIAAELETVKKRLKWIIKGKY